MTEQCRLITKEQLDYYKSLEKKLEIATKALKEYSESENWFLEDSEGKCWSFNKQYPWRIGFKALKEIEELSKLYKTEELK